MSLSAALLFVSIFFVSSAPVVFVVLFFQVLVFFRSYLVPGSMLLCVAAPQACDALSISFQFRFLGFCFPTFLSISESLVSGISEQRSIMILGVFWVK